MTATDTTAAEMSHEEIVKRARALVPTLRERAGRTADHRRLLDETVADLKASGVFKVLQARRNGGYEMSMRTHLDVLSTLGEGCGSSAWVVGVTHAHSWMMSHFDQAAQDETYGVDPDMIISAVIAPRGRAERQPDGNFLLNGFWPFASGSEHAEWVFMGAEVFENDAPVDAGEFLISANDMTYMDDWHVTGLTGTGSCSVVAENLTIPAHRFLSLAELMTGQSAGRPLHDGWQTDLAAFPVLVVALAGGALGMARNAVRTYPEVVGEKVIAYTNYLQKEYPATHLMLAEAAAKVDQAEFHLYRAADQMDDAARSGTPLRVLDRVRIRADAAEAVQLCLEAAQALFQATGGSGLRTSNPIGLALANLQAMSMHGGLAIETARALYGRVLIGLEPDTFTI